MIFVQLIRRVKIDQLWICFSFWWNIFNNRLTAVRIDIFYSLSWCLYWEYFIAFNFIYISVKWVILLWAPPILAAILWNASPLVFQPPLLIIIAQSLNATVIVITKLHCSVLLITWSRTFRGKIFATFFSNFLATQ